MPFGSVINASKILRFHIISKNGKALIDTVNPGFEKELEYKIRGITGPEEIDYVVMNHAEPDHAGAIPYIMKISPKLLLNPEKKNSRHLQLREFSKETHFSNSKISHSFNQIS